MNGCNLCGGMRRGRPSRFPVTVCAACHAPVCNSHVRFVAKGPRLLHLVRHDELDPTLTAFLGEKLCAGCGRWKQLAAFGSHPSSADGHSASCRDCASGESGRMLCVRCLRDEPAEVRREAIAAVC